jgi:hypothetical protein
MLIRTNSLANKLDRIWLSSLVRFLSTVTKVLIFKSLGQLQG